MVVKFADICDGCEAQSDDYTAWPTCRECLVSVCPDCSAPGTLVSDDGRESVICRPCTVRDPWADEGQSDARELARDRW